MGIESWFGKKSVQKTPEQAKLDRERGVALGAAVAGAAALGATAYEAPKEADLMHVEAPAVAPAPAENPTLGMSSKDAPKPITIAHPEGPASDSQVVDLHQEPKIINLEAKTYVVEHPEN